MKIKPTKCKVAMCFQLKDFYRRDTLTIALKLDSKMEKNHIAMGRIDCQKKIDSKRNPSSTIS